MKKFFYALILAITAYGCQTTDDQLVAICDAPKELSATVLSHTSVEISWASDITATDFVVEYGFQGFRPGTGSLAAADNSPYILSGLLSNTKYEVYLRAFCGESNISLTSHMVSFTTKSDPVATDFMPSLSQMHIYAGHMSDLTLSDRVFEYSINTPLFTDYALKQRIIALPENTSMTYTDDLLPDFPEHTVIAKTFSFNDDERDQSLGRTIIETRVLIKKNGVWESGNYVWNASQTDAFLDPNGSMLPISYIDADGNTNAFTYKIPSNQDCITCHQNNGDQYPIGPKMRSMNFSINGTNQLENFIANGYLTNVSDASQISSLPNWENESLSLEERSRAYLDINCAHCHQPGGYFDINNFSYMDLSYETSFADSKIYEMRYNIRARMQNYLPGFSMPFIGTTMKHDEGFNLIEAFIDTL